MRILVPFVATQVTAQVMDRLPSLGLIATRHAGTDHIDTAEAARRGIAVANVPDYGSVAGLDIGTATGDSELTGAGLPPTTVHQGRGPSCTQPALRAVFREADALAVFMAWFLPVSITGDCAGSLPQEDVRP